MTNDIEFLPLPEPDIGMPGQVAFIRSDKLLQEWCRANVAHATAAKDAEIEALLSKLEDAVRDGLNEHCRAERLAEALRHLRNHTSVNSHQIELIDAALRPTAEQEGRESFWPKLPASGGPDWTGHD